MIAVLSTVLNAGLDRRADVYLELVEETYTAWKEEREPTWMNEPWPALEVFGSEQILDELGSLGDAWMLWPGDDEMNAMPHEQARAIADGVSYAVGLREAVIHLVNRELANDPPSRWSRWRTKRRIRKVVADVTRPV